MYFSDRKYFMLHTFFAIVLFGYLPLLLSMEAPREIAESRPLAIGDLCDQIDYVNKIITYRALPYGNVPVRNLKQIKLNSLSNLHKQEDAKKAPDYNQPSTIIHSRFSFCLDFSHLNIASLNGLKKIKKKLSNLSSDSDFKYFDLAEVTALKLNGNCLERVDLDKIFKLFPNVRTIGLKNNQLSAIKHTNPVENYMALYLTKNNFTQLPVLKTTVSYIRLLNNPLCASARFKARFPFLKPALLDSILSLIFGITCSLLAHTAFNFIEQKIPISYENTKIFLSYIPVKTLCLLNSCIPIYQRFKCKEDIICISKNKTYTQSLAELAVSLQFINKNYFWLISSIVNKHG